MAAPAEVLTLIISLKGFVKNDEVSNNNKVIYELIANFLLDNCFSTALLEPPLELEHLWAIKYIT